MNHLGDTNKMVDTPRTEAEVNRQKCWSDDLITIDANFACQLERELNAANIEIEEKRKDVVWLATEKAKSENYVTELENRLRALWDKYDGDSKHYIDHIKRLEEQLMDTKNKHAVLVADVVLNEDRAERIKRLETLGHELRECASRIGTVASGEGSVIRRTEEAIQAWDKEANQ